MQPFSTILSKNPRHHTSHLSNKRNGTFFNGLIQPKLTINQPNGQYEREAEAVAEQVTRMPANENGFFRAAPNLVLRKCAHCEEEEKNVHMKSGSNVSNGATVSPTVHDVINSPGQSLDAGTKNFMESRFSYDFGKVQIHNDSLAQQSSKEINALAYTHGNHVVLGSGQYQPNTDAGKQLLAHELTHVIQQKHEKGIQRKKEEKFDRETFIRENCVGVQVDSSKSQCKFEGKQAIVFRLAKEHALRNCSIALRALDVMRVQELDDLAETIFHLKKAPPRKEIRSTIQNVRTKLETTPIFCKTCFDEHCNKGGTMAYTPMDHSSISICPLFFNNEKLTETPRFLIHEGCHLADVDITNKFSQKGLEEYCKTEESGSKYWDNPCPVISETLTNADAWSYFIERLSLKV
jgi:predicted SprT family Zn-dependent metalloprotease